MKKIRVDVYNASTNCLIESTPAVEVNECLAVEVMDQHGTREVLLVHKDGCRWGECPMRT